MDLIDNLPAFFGSGILLTLFIEVTSRLDFGILLNMFREYPSGNEIRRKYLPMWRNRQTLVLPEDVTQTELQEIFGFEGYKSTDRCTLIIEDNSHIVNLTGLLVHFRFIRLTSINFIFSLENITSIDLSHIGITDAEIVFLNSLTNLRTLSIRHGDFYENEQNLKLNLTKFNIKCVSFVTNPLKKNICFKFLINQKNLRELCCVTSSVDQWDLNDYTSIPFEKIAMSVGTFHSMTKICIDLPVQLTKLKLLEVFMQKCPSLQFISFNVYVTDLVFIQFLCEKVLTMNDLQKFQLCFGFNLPIPEETMNYMISLEKTKFSFTYNNRCTFCHP